MVFNDIIITSPFKAFLSLGQMSLTLNFWMNVGVTMKRFSLGLLFGSLGGFVLGVCAGLKPQIKWLLEPFRWTLMTMPPAILVIISMIWFGMGTIQTVFVTALLIAPIIYINTISGIETIDSQILEMGRVYGANIILFLKEIYLPGIGGSILAGLTLATGLGIRIVVLAELLGAYSGIGYEFSLARTNIDTPALFAWIMVCLLLGGSLDIIILKPIKNYIMRWRNESDSVV